MSSSWGSSNSWLSADEDEDDNDDESSEVFGDYDGNDDDEDDQTSSGNDEFNDDDMLDAGGVRRPPSSPKKNANRVNREPAEAREARQILRRLVHMDERSSAPQAPPDPLAAPLLAPAQDDAAEVQPPAPIAVAAPTAAALESRQTAIYLWARLAKILQDEFLRTNDVYAHTLDYHDRGAFERLAEIISWNSKFGTMLDLILLSGNAAEEIFQLAVYCAFLICEGRREAFGASMAPSELIPFLVNERCRVRRMVPYSMLFSALDHSDQLIGDAVQHRLPRVLLHRSRHFVSSGRLASYMGSSLSQDDSHQDHNHPAPLSGADLGSPLLRKLNHPPRRNMFSPMLRQVAQQQQQECGGSDAVHPRKRPREELDQAHLADAAAERSTTTAAARAAASASRSPLLVPAQTWPFVGGRVGRGPDWCYPNQGKRCDYGTVIGWTQHELIVEWNISADQQFIADLLIDDHANIRRLFRYKSNHFVENEIREVVPWREFLAVKTLQGGIDFRLEEFFMLTALVGILCCQRESIVAAIETQAVESMLHICRMCDVEGARLAYEEKRKKLLDSLESRLVGKNEAARAFVTDQHEPWITDVWTARRFFRVTRELSARALWVLNALLMHRRLTQVFRSVSGIDHVLRLADTATNTNVVYGCGLVFSQLARSDAFEEFLIDENSRERCFSRLIAFALRHAVHSANSDVRGAVAAFFLHSLNYPMVLAELDRLEGLSHLVRVLEKTVLESADVGDVVNSAEAHTHLRCIATYLTSHLVIASRALFRRNRALLNDLTKSPTSSLPKEPHFVEALTLLLTQLTLSTNNPSEFPREVTLGVFSAESLTSFARAVELGVLPLLFQCVQLYTEHSRHELVQAALQSLRILVIAPFLRTSVCDVVVPPLKMDNEQSVTHRGIGVLLHVVEAFDYAAREEMTSITTALQILVLLTAPPPAVPSSTDDETNSLSAFLKVCEAVRANDGIRILIAVMKSFLEDHDRVAAAPVVAHAVQVLANLQSYSDTRQVLHALGVHRVASNVVHTGITAEVQRKLHGVEIITPVVNVAENLQLLLSGSVEGGSGANIVSWDPFESMERQMIARRAHIEYNKSSLLSLISNYLEQEGLSASAAQLKAEAKLPSLPVGAAPSSPLLGKTATPTFPAVLPGQQQIDQGSAMAAASTSKLPTLDGIVRGYLRQVHEWSLQPIATLPPFDLTKSLEYSGTPRHTAHAGYQNYNNRVALRSAGISAWRRVQKYQNAQFARSHRLMFDIRGSGDDLAPTSVTFCDEGRCVMVGTSEGGVALFDVQNELSLEKLVEQHIVFDESPVVNIALSPDSQLVAATSEAGVTNVMRRVAMPTALATAPNSVFSRFSHDGSLLAITCKDDTLVDERRWAQLMDLETLQLTGKYEDPALNNVRGPCSASLDATSQLLLIGTVLWDVRAPFLSSPPIFRFDRVSGAFGSCFHANNTMVIVDDSVWDLRMMSMVQSCKFLQGMSCYFPSPLAGSTSALYAFSPQNGVRVVHTVTFDLLATHEFRPQLNAFALDPHERYFVGTQNLDGDGDHVVRVYGIGMEPDDDFLNAEPEEGPPNSSSDSDDDGSTSDEGDDEESSDVGSDSRSSSLTADDFGSDDEEDDEESDEEDDDDEDDEDSDYPEDDRRLPRNEQPQRDASVPVNGVHDDEGPLPPMDDAASVVST